MKIELPLEEALELSAVLSGQIATLDTAIGDVPELETPGEDAIGEGVVSQTATLLSDKRERLDKTRKRIETALNKL